MATSVTVQPRVLRWARERASLAPSELARRLGLKEDRVHEWEATGQITLPRLEQIAHKTYTPVGFLFLPEPPQEPLPIPDFRTLDSTGVERPSVNLLDTIYQCQQRQAWYREYLVAEGEAPVGFVGSASPSEPPATVANRIRDALSLKNDVQSGASNWEEALTSFIGHAEAVGILVMRNGVVGNNTHRKLAVHEFRGFALSDNYAPLVFINAADAKAAQMFTLTHEVAHLWLGESGVSDARPGSLQASERYCNAVASEVLVPEAEFVRAWNAAVDPLIEARRIARQFKVSTLVVLIRALETGALPRSKFDQLFAEERERAHVPPPGGGGDFYNTQGSRLGKRFARAVVASAIEGRTTYSEAYELLGFRKQSTFDQLAKTLKVVL